MIQSSAIQSAKLYSTSLNQFRSIYSQDVVSKAKNNGLRISHNHLNDKKAIPLPATITIKLAEQIGNTTSGAKAKLYSPYPFPWRKKKSQASTSTFDKEAWSFLQQNKSKTYLKFEENKTGAFLRYATADIMRNSCVACHNNHADTPKKDWKIGDVRGILSIQLPLENIKKLTDDTLKNTFLAYNIIGIIIFIIITTVIIKSRQRSTLLQKQVEERTKDLNDEVIEKESALTALSLIEEHNSLLLNSATEGIYGIDIDGITTFVNPAACEMLGYKQHELINNPINKLIHNSSSAIKDSKYNINEVQHDEDTLLWRKTGESFSVEYTSTPLKKDGSVIGAVIIFSDITERKKIEKMKEEFISTVSHELRTPLTSIKGSLGLILGGATGELSPQTNDMLKVSYENSTRLNALINDLLDLSKLDSNEITLELKTLKLNDQIEAAANAIFGYANKFRVKIETQVDTTNNVIISVDKNRLQQVFSNLLSNAIKYSPEGSNIIIKTELRHPMVRINIIDNGSGIPEKYRARIFERFTQIDSSDTRQVGGTGLGLAIVKEIIEQHDGKIDFISSSSGTTFYFDLPLPS